MTIAVTMYMIGDLQTGQTSVSKATKGSQELEKDGLIGEWWTSSLNTFCRTFIQQIILKFSSFCEENFDEGCKWRIAKLDGTDTSLISI